MRGLAFRSVGPLVMLVIGPPALGCVDAGAVDLTGRGCPCAEGWICMEGPDGGVCVQEIGPSMPGRDGGPRADVPGVDGGPVPDAPGVDAPGVDGGSMMPTGEAFWIEAEDGTIEAPMEVRTDAAASNGEYVAAIAGTANSGAMAPATGNVAFTIPVTVAGTYRVWGRVIAVDDSTDSFWVRSGGMDYQWNNLSPRAAWDWDDVHHTDSAAMTENVVDLDLAAGDQTIQVYYREVGAQLDKILVTNDLAYTPSGAGL